MTQDIDVNAVAQAAVSKTEIVLRDAEALAITNPEEYREAGARLREIVTRRKDVDDERKRLLQPVDLARQRIQELFSPALNNLMAAEMLIKRGISNWTAEQERLRRIAEAEAVEAARKESDRLASLAQRAAEKGHFEKAAALEGQADNVPIAELPEPVKAQGISTRESWHAEVTDRVALIQAVARGEVPAEAIDVNMVYLNQAARALKSGLKWPGVEAVREDVVAVRAGIQSSDYVSRRSLK